MPTRKPPTVRLRRLAGELKRLRTEAQMTREQVNERTRLDISSIYRIETARTRPQRRTILALLELYGVTDPADQAPFVDMLAKSDQLSWLETVGDAIPDGYQAFIAFEAEATRIQACEGQFIPGLLQTEGYARAAIEGAMPEASVEAIEDRVEVRMRRQEVLSKGFHLWAILDEAVIRRVVGGGGVHRGQLGHLLTMSEHPHVTAQVVPFTAGSHPGMEGPFMIMDFPEDDPPLIYTEIRGGGLFLEAAADVQRYRTAFQHLAAQALSPKDTIRLISQAASAA